MDSQERFENMVGLVEAHQYEWAIWQAAARQEPDISVVKRISTQMGWAPSEPPIGWRLVPVSMTLAMYNATGMVKDAPYRLWKALLDAAPTPEHAQESLYTMNQMREYAFAFHKEHVERIRPLALRTALKNERAQESAGVLTDEQIREIWMRETGTTEQDSPLAILDFARAVIAADKEPQP